MDKMYTIKNRSASVVVYSVPELGIRRSFAPGESKKVKFEEIEKLTYQRGGMEILTRFLQVQDDEIIKSFNMKVEPEYYMSESDVVKLLQTGSLDAFLDALDFAPTGVVDLIKRLSISLPLTDISKRKALKAKTGFDVEAALKHIEEDKEDESNTILETPAQRRVQPAAPAADTAPVRRTTPKYNVVNKGEEATKTE